MLTAYKRISVTMNDTDIVFIDDPYTESSSSDETKKSDSQTQRKKNDNQNRKSVSFASLPSQSNLFRDKHESDFIDSLELLSISLQNELKLIHKLLPDTTIKCIQCKATKSNTVKIILNKEEFAANPLEIIFQILHIYPAQVCFYSLTHR